MALHSLPFRAKIKIVLFPRKGKSNSIGQIDILQVHKSITLPFIPSREGNLKNMMVKSPPLKGDAGGCLKKIK